MQLSLRNLGLRCRRLADDQIDPAPDSGQRAYSAVVMELRCTRRDDEQTSLRQVVASDLTLDEDSNWRRCRERMASAPG